MYWYRFLYRYKCIGIGFFIGINVLVSIYNARCLGVSGGVNLSHFSSVGHLSHGKLLLGK